MASIAYITDSNMLEHHRLNGHNTMNFWRLSNKINFKDFSEGDLVFFLSKDKEQQKAKEKGIVGYGRLDSIHLNSVNYLWKKYETENGYSNLEDFKEAIRKVSRNNELPKLISSFYLTEVMFFQVPLYLSEFGLEISGNVESFVYLNPEVTVRLLNAKVEPDMFFALNGGKTYKEKHRLEYAISLMQEKVKDINCTDAIKNKAAKELRNYIELHPEYSFVKGSKMSLNKIGDKEVTFYLYKNKNFEDRIIYGQAALYKHYLEMFYPEIKKLSFESNDDSLQLDRIINY